MARQLSNHLNNAYKLGKDVFFMLKLELGDSV